MEEAVRTGQVAQAFNWTLLLLPALFSLVPVALFAGGYRISRKYMPSFAGKSLYWLGGHGVTLVLAATLTALRGSYVPDMIVTQLPLLLTVLYLLLGLVVRSPFLFSLGLATPGLWLFFVESWEAFSGSAALLYTLPREPFWCLLAAIVIFNLRHLPKPRQFWEDCEAFLVTISASYFMGGLWLLALGQPSLLGKLGPSQFIWAAALMLVAAFLLWCGRYLRDPLFAVCSGIGLIAGGYAFITHYPWQ